MQIDLETNQSRISATPYCGVRLFGGFRFAFLFRCLFLFCVPTIVFCISCSQADTTVLTLDELQILIYDGDESNLWTWKHKTSDFRIVEFKSEPNVVPDDYMEKLSHVIADISMITKLKFDVISADNLDQADSGFFFEGFALDEKVAWADKADAVSDGIARPGLAGLALDFLNLSSSFKAAQNGRYMASTACYLNDFAMRNALNKGVAVFDFRADGANEEAFVSCMVKAVLFSVGLRGVKRVDPKSILVRTNDGYELKPKFRCALAVLYSDAVVVPSVAIEARTAMKTILVKSEACK